jgi:hypothetical protein
LVASNTTMMTASDYRELSPANVIGDCELAAGFGWNACIYYAGSDTDYGLFFDNANTSTAYSSDLRISNDLADLDTTTPATFLTGTTFAASYDASLTRDPSSVASGAHIPWSDGVVYRTRDATDDIFGAKDLSGPNTNIRSASKAEAVADDFLFQHSTEEDNISVKIEVPTSKVNHLRAGHRVQVKFTHLPGYESFTWCRVIRRTVIQENATDRYILDMDLSPQEAAAPAPSGASIVQSAFGFIPAGTTLSLPFPVTIGNLLVFCIGQRNFSDPVAPFNDVGHANWGTDPWTKLPNVTAGQRDDGVAIWYKTADSTSATGFIGATNAVVGIFEIAGGDIGSATTASKDEQAANTTMNIGSLGTPAANSVCIQVGLYFDQKNSSDASFPAYTPGSGWTLGTFHPAYYGGVIQWNAPLNWIAYQVTDGTAVSATGSRSGLLHLDGKWGGAAICIPPA